MKLFKYLLLILVSFISAQDFKQVNFELYKRGLISFYFPKNFDSEQVLKDIATFESNLEKLEKFSGRTLQESIEVYIFKSIESKTLSTKNANRTHFNLSSKTIYASSNGYSFLEEDDGYKTLLLKLLLGNSKYLFLEEGLATYLTPKWQGRGYRYWFDKFVGAAYPISRADLFNSQIYAQHSTYIRKTYAAFYVARLLQVHGKTKFLKYYTSSQIPSIAFSFQKQPSPRRPKVSKNLPFLKGFNFAHEGYSVYNGYLGHLIIPALKHLKSLNINTVAIVPYTYMPNPAQPRGLNIPKRIGSETDESIIHSLVKAKFLGLLTLLKPQIWLSGSWSGEINMTNEKDWKLFLDKYERWILHYAFLAARYDVDLLSLGVEMHRVTQQYPAFWRQLAAKVRQIYDGKITYSANWYQEFEGIRFWEALDYISINCYYPLSQDNQPTKADLKHTFETVFNKLDQVSKQYRKPLLFTEMGFRSSAMPWKAPHSSPQTNTYRPDHQALCYEAICEVLKTKTYAGVYWWKWPSFLNYAHYRPLSFTPYGKPAEAIIRNYFK